MGDYLLSSRKTQISGMTTFVLCIILLTMFLSKSDTSAEYMKRGLKICFETLIPSLFPFMVISEILSRTGACEPLSRLMKRPMKALFRIPGEAVEAILLGIICGFPVGAKVAFSLYIQGDISKKDCEKLLSFCNFPSAPFMIFAVGKGMFGNKSIGLLLYFTILFTGLAWGILTRNQGTFSYMTAAKFKSKQREKLSSTLAASVTSSAQSVISVSAFVCFFSCAVGCLSALFDADSASPLRALIFSFFELTSGSAACAVTEPSSLAVILAAAAGSWSGLSVFLQIRSLTQNDGDSISLIPYIKAKAVAAPLCAVITAAFLNLFPSVFQRNSTDAETFSPLVLYPKLFMLTVNIIFVLASLICLYKLLDRKRKI